MLRLFTVLIIASLPLLATRPAPAGNDHQSLAGQLLVAAPTMRDSRFSGTVIYMCQHSEDGALGLVINRTMGTMPANVIAKEFNLDAKATDDEIQLVWGGPVELSRGLVLHSTDYLDKDSLVVADGVALSTEPQVMIDILEGHGPKRTVMALGYAGWGPGQLESELARRDWITVPTDADFVFGHDPDDMWRAAMAQYSIEL